MSKPVGHATPRTDPSGAADPASRVPLLPFDPVTGRSLPPRPQPGYYPGFNTMSQRRFWDAATRNVVMDRVEHPPASRFFTPEELPLITAVCDRLMPQDDRDAAQRVPLVNSVDDRLASGRIHGYRFDNMPPDPEAYRLGLRGIDLIARRRYGRPFVELGPREQDETLLTIHDGEPPAGDDIWASVPPRRFWTLILGDVLEAYYAHPYAWDEIGFGGPAYPRGYMRLERGEPEPWEVRERRYDWAPPPESISGDERARDHAPQSHRDPVQGQEGTH